MLQNVFLKLINIFVFSVFILVDAFSASFTTEKSQKNLFTLAESNFSERKLSCTRMNFGEILFAGTKRAVPGSPGRAVSLAHSGSQSEHRIRRITHYVLFCVDSSGRHGVCDHVAVLKKIIVVIIIIFFSNNNILFPQ